MGPFLRGLRFGLRLIQDIGIRLLLPRTDSPVVQMVWMPSSFDGITMRQTRGIEAKAVGEHIQGRAEELPFSASIRHRTFQLHGAASGGRPVFRKKLSRPQFARFMAEQSPCLVALEACASASFGRAMARYGHEVRMIAPQ
jgi:hypothetical protein